MLQVVRAANIYNGENGFILPVSENFAELLGGNAILSTTIASTISHSIRYGSNLLSGIISSGLHQVCDDEEYSRV